MSWRGQWGSILALIGANAIPVIGVLWWGWQLPALLFGYWLETAIVCSYTFLKILGSQATDEISEVYYRYHPARGFSFFIADKGHYATEFINRSFWLLIINLFFIWLIFLPTTLSSGVFSLFSPTAGLQTDFNLAKIATTHWLPLAVALLLSHGYSFLANYVFKKEYQRIAPKQLMVTPFRRVAAMQITMIVGGFLLLQFGQSILYLLVLITAKIVIDIISHLEEHLIIPPPDGEDLVTETIRQI
ncbi:MAG: DUF6498-containing protein [Patescibacteria group bacterium]